MRIALIGANGQLGTDLCRAQADIIALVRPQVDVCDEAGLQRAFERVQPDVVINCAAETHVDRCETETAAAYAVNAVGALHVARQAARIGAAVVLVSTDYVFGGDELRTTPYSEDDAPAPTCVYGASKLSGEHLTAAYNPRHLIVRSGGLYGHAGARGKGGNFVETMLRLAREGRPVRVVADQRLSPTSTHVLAERVLGLIRAEARGVVHVGAADDCTWHEFATAIFELSDLNVEVAAIRSAEFAAAARRPGMCALRSGRLGSFGVPACPGWREMLEQYLAHRTVRPVAPQPVGSERA